MKKTSELDVKDRLSVSSRLMRRMARLLAFLYSFSGSIPNPIPCRRDIWYNSHPNQRSHLTLSSGERKKRGKVLSNLYKLTLPKRTPKAEEEVVFEPWDDVDNSESRVSQ